MQHVDTTIQVSVLTKPKTLWMLVDGEDKNEPDKHFHSNFALDSPPHPSARFATVIYMAVSMWDETGLEELESLAAINPQAGRFVAQVDLKPKHKSKPTGICVADTGAPGHWSVWGTPTKLGRCLADIKAVGFQA